MALEFAPDLPSLSTELQRFMMLEAGDLPEHARERLLEFAGHPSPVDRVVNSAEAIYAVAGEVSNGARDMGARLAQFAAVNGWHGMGERGFAMAAALQRMAGHEPPAGTTWPEPETDPEPLAHFLPTAE